MKILFATDGSKPAVAAQKFLASLPLPAGTSIRVVTATGELTWQAPDWAMHAQREWAKEICGAARSALTREGSEVTAEVRTGSVAGEILCAAEDFGADLVVVGSAGLTGLAGWVLGSVARNVAHHATQSVLVARSPEDGLRHAVLAVDGSEHANRAAAIAGQLPLPAEAEIIVVNVLKVDRPFAGGLFREPDPFPRERLEYERERRATATALVETARASLEASGRRANGTVRSGDPATEILALAQEQRADLIIAGARGVSTIRRLIVGSVADRLLKTADCSVLIAR